MATLFVGDAHERRCVEEQASRNAAVRCAAAECVGRIPNAARCCEPPPNRRRDDRKKSGKGQAPSRDCDPCLSEPSRRL